MNAALPPAAHLEFRLLNEFQRDLPLTPAPFAAMAQTLGSDEATVIAELQRLQASGTISRVGAVFAPRSVGASTLAALAVPPAQLEAVAAQVSQHAGVNHNYEREHRYNLWFVATAADEAALAALLADIGTQTGLPPIALPLVEEFHIDLGFDLIDGGKKLQPTRRCVRRETSDADKRLIAALQPGLPLVARPFAQLAESVGLPESALVERLAEWLDDGCIKRMGVVVRHHELGYKANAMAVFDVPDADVSAVGQRLAHEAGVTLCYRRERHLPWWTPNLYCMVHGRSREEVEPIIDRLCRVAGYPCEALFSLRRFKQCGARYFDAAKL
ncbi:MAG: Lrp/AsnC family transcriptional regulator [Rhodocyclaceae bacterium]|nr:Lrp/AsnC family transcriptional regulator [Rhodocyclaceae bacterium]MDZ4215321.1 Lrp/AsnC family transcriptional regulator [Rhodocyclaceae bacterium]